MNCKNPLINGHATPKRYGHGQRFGVAWPLISGFLQFTGHTLCSTLYKKTAVISCKRSAIHFHNPHNFYGTLSLFPTEDWDLIPTTHFLHAWPYHFSTALEIRETFCCCTPHFSDHTRNINVSYSSFLT